MKPLCVTLIFALGLLSIPVPNTEPVWARWAVRGFVFAWAIWLQRKILNEPTKHTKHTNF